MGIVCISINTRNKSLTQYHNYIFNSLCIWRGNVYGTKPDGVYHVSEEYDNDNSIPISSFGVTLDSDFGVPNQKRLRFIDVRYQTSGSILLSYMADRGLFDDVSILPEMLEMRPHGRKIPTTRNIKGTYFRFKFSNVDGADFTIGAINTNVVILDTGNSL